MGQAARREERAQWIGFAAFPLLADSFARLHERYCAKILSGKKMNPPFRSKQEVVINAPLETVWEFGMDITRIPAFHPRVVKVELLSGKARREPGVSYRCHLAGGKHTCVEKDIEIIPKQKIVTVLPEDTFGISKILPDYVVETTVHRVGQSSTKIEISHYYSTPTLKAKLLNLIARRKIARDTQDTLNGMKAAIEERGAAVKNG
jgi:polyketide cyclase/dehydrase/lipid transport protein